MSDEDERVNNCMFCMVVSVRGTRIELGKIRKERIKKNEEKKANQVMDKRKQNDEN